MSTKFQIIGYFLLCLLVFSYGFNLMGYCPPGALIRPCECFRRQNTPTVHCASFTNVHDLQEVFANTWDYHLPGFTLKDSCLMYIPALSLVSKRIEKLTVSDSVLIALFDQRPDFDNVVSHLKLVRCRFLRGFQWGHFKFLRDLVDFEAEHVEIKAIEKTFRNNMNSRVQKITLVNSKTKYIADDAFNKLKELKVIQVRNSDVSVLKRSMFPLPGKLALFDFSGNRITNLPADMFDGFPHMLEVNLAGNRIEYFYENVFKRLYDTPTFQINMRDNDIACVCSLRWFLDASRKIEVFGVCAHPENLQGKLLMKLTPKDFDCCSSSSVYEFREQRVYDFLYEEVANNGSDETSTILYL